MSVKETVGNSTFIILEHLGFRLLWDDVRMNSFEQCEVLGLPDETWIDLVLTADETTVLRRIQFSDLWEEVPATLIASLAAWNFLVEPFGGR